MRSVFEVLVVNYRTSVKNKV